MNTYMNLQIFFFAGGLLAAGMQITASAILLRERSTGAYLMLGGAIASVLGFVGSHAFIYLIVSNLDHQGANMMRLQMMLSGLALLGNLTFFAGLLLHALRRQAIAERVTELETLIAARDAG